MTKENVPYLCGGILFSLLLKAIKPRTKARNKLNGGSDGLSETNIMTGLVKVVTGTTSPIPKGGTLRKSTTHFKTCKNYSPLYIPFTDLNVIRSFEASVKQNDSDLLNRMSEFINEFLDTNRSEWLVKAIIEVILNDSEIPLNRNFTIAQGKFLSKEELAHITEIELPIFMLSVLDFILHERKDNSKGRQTFEAWHSQKGPRSQWIFRSDIGNFLTQKIKIISDSNPPEPESVQSQASKSQYSTADKPHERVEDPLIPTTAIQHQTNIVQNGNNNLAITNNGTINIKL